MDGLLAEVSNTTQNGESFVHEGRQFRRTGQLRQFIRRDPSYVGTLLKSPEIVGVWLAQIDEINMSVVPACLFRDHFT
jgi:hypothetical protein